MKALIVIPAFNEADNLSQLLPKLRHISDLDVLVVDDFSQDNTVQVVRGFDIECLQLSLQLGAWGATQTGIRYAKKNGYDHVITMDADGQHLPEELVTLTDAVAVDANNVIIGTCPQRLSKLKPA
jgi:glycosyltransferase involved in cell wall biosynthesis